MKKVPETDLDQLFANALGDLRAEAPEKVWRSVSSVISAGGTAGPGLLTRLIKPASWFSAGLIIVVGSYFTVDTLSQSDLGQASPAISRAIVPQQDIAVAPLLNPQTALSSQLALNPTSPAESDINPAIGQSNTINHNLQNNNPDLTAINTSSDQSSPLAVASTLLPVDFVKETAPNRMSTLQNTALSFQAPTIAPESLGFAMNSYFLPPPDYVRPMSVSLVFSSGPDVFSFDHNLFDASRSAGWNTGLASRFQFTDFFFSAGINYIGVRQRNPYDYTINEFLQVGEYTHVDSVVMVEIIDSLGNSILEPHYYTTQLPLLDSVPVAHRTNVYDHYRFLEIPISIGMRKDVKRFSFTAQAGFTYTFNIGNNEMSLTQFEERSGFQLLDWQKQSFGRLQHFWSFTFSMGASYNLNNHLAIGIEPTYRYFVEPFYEGSQPDRKSPFSFGCRFNIHYTL